jgi:hypothetical protein
MANYLPAELVKHHGCVFTSNAVGDAVIPKSRMWGPQVRFCERGPRESGGPYSTTARARRQNPKAANETQCRKSPSVKRRHRRATREARPDPNKV